MHYNNKSVLCDDITREEQVMSTHNMPRHRNKRVQYLQIVVLLVGPSASATQNSLTCMYYE